MAKNSLLMETTKVSSSQSAADISAYLVRYGAKSISTEYQGGKICGLRWTMRIKDSDVVFDMPAKVEAVLKCLQREGTRVKEEALKEKAERIAWRQLYRWVQAQVCMIQLGMAEVAEVFMPYIVVDHNSNKRLYAAMVESRFKALPAPKEDVN